MFNAVTRGGKAFSSSAADAGAGFLSIRSVGIVNGEGGRISDKIGNLVGPTERPPMDGRAELTNHGKAGKRSGGLPRYSAFHASPFA